MQDQSTDVASGSAPRAVNMSAGDINMAVSSQWWNRPDDERYTSLGDLYAATKAAYDASKAETVDSRAIEVLAPENPENLAQTRELSFVVGEEQAIPTHWSFGQACSLVQAPASYLRRLPSQLAADNLSWGLRGVRQEQVKLYTRTNGSQELRAITGPDYGRIPDCDVVAAVQEYAGNGTGDMPWKIPGTMKFGSASYDPLAPVTKASTTLYASDHDVFMFLVDDCNPIEVGKLANGEPDLMFRGFYSWNSEVGARSAGIATMYLRAVCENRLLWGVEGFKEITMRHSKYAPDRFVTEAMPALQSYASGSTANIVAAVEDAKAARIADDDDDALAFLQKRKFSRKAAAAIVKLAEEEEHRPLRTVWDASQAITAYARNVQHQDTRLDIEKTAGRLLDTVA